MSNPNETMGLTKTMMTYSQGELVLYDNLPYLVIDYDPMSMRLVMAKVGGGRKKVPPKRVMPIEGLAATYSSIEDVPFEILKTFYPGLIRLVGSGWQAKQTLLNKTDFSARDVYLRPVGKSAENFFGLLETEFEDVHFIKRTKLGGGTLRGGAKTIISTHLVVTYDRPSPNAGYIKKKINDFMANPSIIIYACDKAPPPGYTAHIDVGELLSRVKFRRCWIIQVRNIAEMTREEKSIIVGLAGVLGKVRKTLDVPR